MGELDAVHPLRCCALVVLVKHAEHCPKINLMPDSDSALKVTLRHIEI